MEAIKNLDERITIFLTGIVWWIDVHYNKNNIWCAKAMFLFLGPVLGSLIQAVVFMPGEGGSLLINFVAVVLFSFMFECLVWWVLFEFGKIVGLEEIPTILKNAKETPNPNKVFFFAYVLKVFQITYLICFSRSAIDITTNITELVAIYFLCTDNIPPAEKKKRKEEKEMRGAVPTLA